jgi:DNA-binding CsgD family transcriptional regulator
MVTGGDSRSNRQELRPLHRELDLLKAVLTEPSRSAMAARLGCSPRHVRRLVRALLHRLDLPSTHAAVALAAWRGWITEEDLPRHHQ